MQIHRIPTHERDFVIIANKAIQDPRISHTARGILALVLSLPSGVKENVRTLSDNYPQGRNAVAKAVAELREFGYWVTKTGRDDETNQIVSSVDVYELPNLAPAPVPTRPITSPAATRKAGTSPYGEKDSSKHGEKNPPFPPAEPAQDEAAPFGAGEREGSSEKQDDKQSAEAARILRRLAAIDTRLKLSDRQVSKLLPSVADWMDRGATIAEITDAVTQGLPAKVYSASKLIADRLDRKRPERKRQWKQYADCADGCGRVLPAGQESGICGICSGVQPSAVARELLSEAESGPLAPEGLAAFRAARAAMAK
ncbi:hypothetical protein HW130_18635 [Streptomyces sp. PKU-EA00015]|uniref:hypothetical protein n=1 Tax=Streptomyces sp. PKU-EA00015 TaxID=2748326 RepID=UPI0015A038C4|nr:hypothetical protein [Streptomyces sp. PKU-EA00015]NWF28261.1 hypothetical protein [Streptomyces sp. PKU-EA00015]